MARGQVIAIEVVNLKQIRAKLHEDVLYKKEWRAGFEAAAGIAAAAGAAAAPRGRTGDLGASVTYRMAASATTSARVVATTKHNRYAYGRLLEIAPKYHHVAWLLTAVRGTLGEINAILAGVGKAIEAKWASS